jgi:CheY-like chemotaxis protein
MKPGAILIVDDDSDVRSALAELLEEEGFSVEAARNGHEALIRLRTGKLHPALILLDLMMPGMDGWDFRSEQLRDPQLASVPVVIVSASGFSRESIRTQFRPAAYVEKPIEKDVLLGAIRAIVRSDLRSDLRSDQRSDLRSDPGSGPPGQLDAPQRAGYPEDDGA